MKRVKKTFKRNLTAQRNMEQDIQSISGGSRRRHTCKCKTCGKSMKSKSMKSKSMKKSMKR